MLKRILNKIQRPEDFHIVWGLGLPIFLIILSFFTRPLGVSMVTSLRDEDFANPSTLAFFWGGIIASLPILWLILQFIGRANVTQSEKANKPPLPFVNVLQLTESQTAPLWTISVLALAVMILLDTVALIIGTEQESLILRLDGLNNASAATWLGAIIYFALILPVLEELLFRGMLYPVFAQQSDNHLRAIGLTTLLFIGYYLIQVVEGDFTWPIIYAGLIFPLVLGLTTGTIRAHTHSTLSAIAGHMAFNLFLILKAVLIYA